MIDIRHFTPSPSLIGGVKIFLGVTLDMAFSKRHGILFPKIIEFGSKKKMFFNRL